MCLLLEKQFEIMRLKWNLCLSYTVYFFLAKRINVLMFAIWHCDAFEDATIVCTGRQANSRQANGEVLLLNVVCILLNQSCLSIKSRAIGFDANTRFHPQFGAFLSVRLGTYKMYVINRNYRLYIPHIGRNEYDHCGLMTALAGLHICKNTTSYHCLLPLIKFVFSPKSQIT